MFKRLYKTTFILLGLISLSIPYSFAESRNLLVLGDSISAAFGMETQQGWVNLLQKALNKQENPHYHVINASIVGETSRGGLARLPALLEQYQPGVVIIELGGNDSLRGLSIKDLRNNLSQLTKLSLAANAQVLLVGVTIPANYGRRYTQMLLDSYKLTAEKYNVPLAPFRYEDFALQPGFMQADRIHPSAAAQPKILQQLLPHIKKIL